MKIRGRAWVIAVVVGFVVEAIRAVALNALSYFAVGGGSGLRGSAGLPLGDSLLNISGFLCLLILDLGVGLLYALLGSREGLLPAGDGALGGGLAGAAVGLLGGLFGVLISAVLLPIFAPMFSNIPSQFADEAMLAALVGGIIGGIWGVCLAILRGAILAAIGGAVGASIFKSGPAAAGP
jgi:hypothetical protein